MPNFKNLRLSLTALLFLVSISPATALPTTGLTLLEANSKTLIATYESPYAYLQLNTEVVDGEIKSEVRDKNGSLLTYFTVPVLEGEDLADRYEKMVDPIVAQLLDDPAQRARLEKASFQMVWTYVQMAEELALRLSESEVPSAVLSAVRIHPNTIGKAFEQASAESETAAIIAPFSGSNDCLGACGPGCDWCVGFAGSYLCSTNVFCVLHDAYCGSWSDFFDCSFSSCSF